MKRIKASLPKPQAWKMEDINRIQEVCKDHGYEIDQRTANFIWGYYSEDAWCAGWMYMNSFTDTEIWYAILKYSKKANKSNER